MVIVVLISLVLSTVFNNIFIYYTIDSDYSYILYFGTITFCLLTTILMFLIIFVFKKMTTIIISIIIGFYSIDFLLDVIGNNNDFNYFFAFPFGAFFLIMLIASIMIKWFISKDTKSKKEQKKICITPDNRIVLYISSGICLMSLITYLVLHYLAVFNILALGRYYFSHTTGKIQEFTDSNLQDYIASGLNGDVELLFFFICLINLIITTVFYIRKRSLLDLCYIDKIIIVISIFSFFVSLVIHI